MSIHVGIAFADESYSHFIDMPRDAALSDLKRAFDNVRALRHRGFLWIERLTPISRKNNAWATSRVAYHQGRLKLCGAALRIWSQLWSHQMRYKAGRLNGLGLPLGGRENSPDLGGEYGSLKLIERNGFGRNPGALRMFTYVPPSLAKKAALVVILHGCGQTAAAYDLGTGWTKLADEVGFAVLAPEQVRTNNPNGCFNWFEPGDTARDHGEAASIRNMIEWFVEQHTLDRSRIFITGLSAGGAMTAAMLAAYPDVFAGGAVIAGLPAGSAASLPEALNSMQHPPHRSARDWSDFVRRASPHRGPWPAISVWHGESDAIVSPSNADALISQWADLHGVGPSPAQTEDRKGGHRYRIWRDKNGKAVIEAFNCAGMGHGTPIGGAANQRYGETGPYFLDVGISSTARIAAFWGFDLELGALEEDLANSTLEIHKPHVKRTNLFQRPLSNDAGSVKAVIMKSLKCAGLLKQ